MNTDDQWFNPGDRVMRVQWAENLGLPCILSYSIPFGTVCCVEVCEAYGGKNMVRFIGHTGCFYACCFRRVDEIKLCVEAAKHIKQREEELV